MVCAMITSPIPDNITIPLPAGKTARLATLASEKGISTVAKALEILNEALKEELSDSKPNPKKKGGRK